MQDPEGQGDCKKACKPERTALAAVWQNKAILDNQ